ncbi:MAG: protein kinase [Pseudomonadota bacterium]
MSEARIQELAEATLRLPADEREAWIERACGGDRTLEEAVTSELARRTAKPASPLDFSAGDAIGPYRLLQKLGEGGMGAVFLAEQREPVTRKVAIKVIKLGMDTREVLSRFEAERQALALMSHPNIAAVFDAGATPRGRPYFVMEHVPGVPITVYCDRQRLSIRARITLFRQVCQGVRHAHQKGLIHRDLKPANILVAEKDGRPVVKIIDFGVAKSTQQRLTELTLHTQHGVFIGTPDYTSPEQAVRDALDVDTRTDVYALGVVLYELTVGFPPFGKAAFSGKAFDEILRVVRYEERPSLAARLKSVKTKTAHVATKRSLKPKQLRKAIRGDLSAVVMKAIEKRREDRYEGVAEFEADLSRFLENRPVKAKPRSWTYTGRKFLRRHRVAVAFIVLAMLLFQGLYAEFKGMSDTDRLANEYFVTLNGVHRFVAPGSGLDYAGYVTDATERFGRVVGQSHFGLGWESASTYFTAALRYWTDVDIAATEALVAWLEEQNAFESWNWGSRPFDFEQIDLDIEILRAKVELAYRKDRDAEGLEHARALVALLTAQGDAYDETWMLQAKGQLAKLSAYADGEAEAIELFSEVLPVVRKDPALWSYELPGWLRAYASALSEIGRRDEALQVARDWWVSSESAEARTDRIVPATVVAEILQDRGEYDEAQAWLDRGRELASGAPWAESWVAAERGSLNHGYGALGAAIDAYERSLAVATSPMLRAPRVAGLVHTLISSGEREERWQLWVNELDRANADHRGFYFLAVKAAVRVEEGDPDGARTILDDARTLVMLEPSWTYLLHGLEGAAACIEANDACIARLATALESRTGSDHEGPWRRYIAGKLVAALDGLGRHEEADRYRVLMISPYERRQRAPD